MKKLLISTMTLLFCAASVCATKSPATPKAKAPVVEKKIKVVTTLSVLAALVREVGGDRVSVFSLSKSAEDPHFVKAKPTFKRLVSDADLFMQVGRSLELWVPLVINASQNPKLISGKGLITLSAGVPALEIPKVLSRIGGDVHPSGNPHVWLSPLAVRKMAENIRNALIVARPKSKTTFDKNFNNFERKLALSIFGEPLVKSAGSSLKFLFNQLESGLIKGYLAKRKMAPGGWLKQMSLVDYPFFTYHTVFSYLASVFSLKIAGQIEEKPGVLPSKRYQNQLVKLAKTQGVKHIVAASYYKGIGTKVIDALARDIGAKSIFITVDCMEKETYFAFMNRVVDALVKLKGEKKVVLPAAKKPSKANVQPSK